MTPAAHIAGVPVEELLMPLLAGGAGALWHATRFSLRSRYERIRTRAGRRGV